MKENLSFSQFYEDVNDAWFFISETCVDVSKCHISSEDGIRKIRGLLKPLDRYLGSTSSFAPSADAVEVIRCKDCKHWYDAPVIKEYNSCELDALIRHKDFYCANAERRTDGTDTRSDIG